MTMSPEDLERVVDQALGELPTPRAPRQLRVRVLAAIEAVEPVRVAGRPWFTWPRALQVASVVLAVALATGVAWLWPTLAAHAGTLMPEALRTALGYMDSAAVTGSALGRALHLTWAGVVMPAATLVLILTLMVCTACAVCLAALGRITPGGVSQS